jgi:dTDP-4-dehydrorhamnose reductase
VSDAPRRVLILGATGMLGHEAARVLGRDLTVISAVRDTNRARRHGVVGELTSFDARTEEPDLLIERVRPDAVLNAIGLVKQLPEGQSPSSAIRLNALFPHELALACVARGVRLVHVSTDCVFSGELATPARYTEADVPDARDVYGRTKLLGEVDAPALTLRTSIIGWELDRGTGLLEWLASNRGGEVAGFRGARFSGLTTYELSRVVHSILLEHRDLSGLWHVASEPIDKYELLLCLREALGIDCRISPSDHPIVNRALDPSRFERATGYRAPMWQNLAQDYARQTA